MSIIGKIFSIIVMMIMATFALGFFNIIKEHLFRKIIPIEIGVLLICGMIAVGKIAFDKKV